MSADNVIVLDTIAVRWERLCRAVSRAQQDLSPENVAAVHEARDAYVEAWERDARRKASGTGRGA